MQFVNMAIVPFVISTTMLNYFDSGGLIEEMNFIFLLNMIIPHIIDLFLDPDVIWRYIRNYLLERFLKTNKGVIFNQKQANETVKELDFNISEHYSYVFSTMATALFYFPIFPLGMVYALISMVIHYWIRKVKKFDKKFLLIILIIFS